MSKQSSTGRSMRSKFSLTLPTNIVSEMPTVTVTLGADTGTPNPFTDSDWHGIRCLTSESTDDGSIKDQRQHTSG
jgi:hypothetical protein